MTFRFKVEEQLVNLKEKIRMKEDRKKVLAMVEKLLLPSENKSLGKHSCRDVKCPTGS